MKKYLLLTNDNFAEDYYVFQGDYDSPGEAFRVASRLAHDEKKLCVYRIVTWKPHDQVKSMPRVFGVKMQKCEAEGFVNGELRDFGLRIADCGKVLSPQSEIRNPQSEIPSP